MADFSQMSDDELKAAYAASQAAPAASAAPPPVDYSKMSDDELKSAYAAAQPRSTTEDVVKEGTKGLGRGLASAVGDVGEAFAGPFGPSHHFANLMADFGLTERPQAEPGYGQQITKAAGIEASPQTNYGRYAGTAGEFVGNPESYLGPGGMLAKAATAAGGAVGSEAMGDVANKFAPDSPKTKAALQLIGAIAGGHGTTAAPRLVTPNIIPQERQAMIGVLDREGVPLTAGDRIGSRTVKAAESELAHGRNEAQDQAFTQAAFNRVGEHIGDRPITGQTGAVNTMMNRIGGQFDALAARNNVTADQQLVHDLRDIHDTYNGTPGLYPQETVNSVNGSIRRVIDAIGTGAGNLSGADYLTLRSNLRRAAQGATDPQRAEGLHGVTNALDDAMERTIQRTNPNDAGAWAQTRRDYRNALVLQDWAGSANMTPATLAQAAKRVYGKNQYTRGMDDFSELADAGRNVLKQYPDSGTASRLNIERAMSSVGGGLTHALSGGGGYLAGSHLLGGSEGGVGGLLLGEAMGPFIMRPAARAALMNPLTQGMLSNQVLPYRFGTSPTMEALVNQIKGGQTATPPIPGARKAKDGKWYLNDPNRPGKFIEVRP
jgi:hypothetical protein